MRFFVGIAPIANFVTVGLPVDDNDVVVFLAFLAAPTVNVEHILVLLNSHLLLFQQLPLHSSQSPLGNLGALNLWPSNLELDSTNLKHQTVLSPVVATWPHQKQFSSRFGFISSSSSQLVRMVERPAPQLLSLIHI